MEYTQKQQVNDLSLKIWCVNACFCQLMYAIIEPLYKVVKAASSTGLVHHESVSFCPDVKKELTLGRYLVISESQHQHKDTDSHITHYTEVATLESVELIRGQELK